MRRIYGINNPWNMPPQTDIDGWLVIEDDGSVTHNRLSNSQADKDKRKVYDEVYGNFPVLISNKIK